MRLSGCRRYPEIFESLVRATRMGTWREHTLLENAHYRVTEPFSSSTDNFGLGQTIVFIKAVYSRYDGMTGFHFRSETGEVTAFDVSDNDDIAGWTRRLERITKA